MNKEGSAGRTSFKAITAKVALIFNFQDMDDKARANYRYPKLHKLSLSLFNCSRLRLSIAAICDFIRE